MFLSFTPPPPRNPRNLLFSLGRLRRSIFFLSLPVTGRQRVCFLSLAPTLEWFSPPVGTHLCGCERSFFILASHSVSTSPAAPFAGFFQFLFDQGFFWRFRFSMTFDFHLPGDCRPVFSLDTGSPVCCPGAGFFSFRIPVSETKHTTPLRVYL